MSLDGHAAIVTGGGRGLGRAIAVRLARDGADVLLAGPDEDELAEAASHVRSLGKRSVPVLTDVAREESVEHMVRRASSEFGRIDLLVNNAGIAGPTAAVHEVSRTDWDGVLGINLTGAFLCAKHVTPVMTQQRRGRIVNIASIAGKIGYALRSPYAASKWGLIGLTLTLAKELGPYGIQVNAICPGPVEGNRMRAVIQRRAEETAQSVEQVEREYTQATLLGRLVREDDVAAMTAFLASDEARNITGQTFDVTAGYGL